MVYHKLLLCRWDKKKYIIKLETLFSNKRILWKAYNNIHLKCTSCIHSGIQMIKRSTANLSDSRSIPWNYYFQFVYFIISNHSSFFMIAITLIDVLLKLVILTFFIWILLIFEYFQIFLWEKFVVILYLQRKLEHIVGYMIHAFLYWSVCVRSLSVLACIHLWLGINVERFQPTIQENNKKQISSVT